MFAENYHEQVGAVIGGLLDKFILGGTLACTQLHAHVAAVRLTFHGPVCFASEQGCGKLYRARSRLHRNEILQVNMRLKARVEIYKMHSFALL